MNTPQQLAAEAVRRVLAGRSLTPTLDELLKRHEDLSAGDRGAVWDLSHGTLRHLGLIDAVIAQMLHKPITEAGLRALLAVAIYQMQFTRAPAYAIVSEAVEACKSSGWPWAKGMVNALLRRFQREQTSLLAVTKTQPRGLHSYPLWWIERIRRDFGAQAETVLQAGNQLPGMGLRINRRRWSMSACLEALTAEGLTPRAAGDVCVTLERSVPVTRLPGFTEGWISVQDAGAQRAAAFLDLAAGQRVLDACAAPGGKAAHILEQADVDLLALDNDPARLARVNQNLERLGLTAAVRCADAARVEDWWDGRPFDRILADVPCTGSGVVRRHPDIKWLRREEDIANLAAQAAALLDSLWRALCPGGKLLFVTCSVFQEENRAQIDKFIGSHADASVVPLPGLNTEDLQLLPDQHHDGFYYALLERCC
jgi:16S rRNA (cytosine967-C5)-methyltransferase